MRDGSCKAQGRGQIQPLSLLLEGGWPAIWTHLMQLFLNASSWTHVENRWKLKCSTREKPCQAAQRSMKQLVRSPTSQMDEIFHPVPLKNSVSSVVEHNSVTRDECCGWERAKEPGPALEYVGDRQGAEGSPSTQGRLHLSKSTASETQRRFFSSSPHALRNMMSFFICLNRKIAFLSKCAWQSVLGGWRESRRTASNLQRDFWKAVFNGHGEEMQLWTCLSHTSLKMQIKTKPSKHRHPINCVEEQ